MRSSKYKAHYTRNLPHYQPRDANLFVTFRLVDSLPIHIIDQLHFEKSAYNNQISGTNHKTAPEILHDQGKEQYFSKLDTFLDQASTGPTWLKIPAVAEIVFESICYRNGRVYDLDAFTIMSNHVHAVLRPYNDRQGLPVPLPSIMMSLKRRTARESNAVLGRTGQFWQHESYDHVIRDQTEWQRIIRYILNNPLKAGLVDSWQEWPWTYLRSE